MTNDEMLDLFSGVLRDLLGDESVVLTMTTRREDVPSWDSFNYVTFIASVELQLGVKFRIADVESFETVGAIVAKAQSLLG